MEDSNRDNKNARDDDDPTTFIRAAKYGHHLNLTSLKASINEQCQVCRLFWRLLPEQDRERARHQDQVRSLALAPLDEPRFLTYAYLSSDEGKKYEFQLCLAKLHPVLPFGKEICSFSIPVRKQNDRHHPSMRRLRRQPEHLYAHSRLFQKSHCGLLGSGCESVTITIRVKSAARFGILHVYWTWVNRATRCDWSIATRTLSLDHTLPSATAGEALHFPS